MLLEEAAYQQNIVLQASQAVNMCLALHEGMSTGSSEEIEAERLLRFSSTYFLQLFIGGDGWILRYTRFISRVEHDISRLPKPSQAHFHLSTCRFENALTVFGFAKAYNKSNEVKK